MQRAAAEKRSHTNGKTLLRRAGGGDGYKTQMMPMILPTIMQMMEKAQTYRKLALI